VYRVEKHVALDLDNGAGNAQQGRRALSEPVVADRAAEVFAGSPARSQIGRADVLHLEVVGRRELHQDVVVGQQVERQVEMHPHFEHGQRGAGRAVHDRPPARVPPAVGEPPASAAQIGVRPADQPPQDHQAAMPWPIR
jgi:hypothetical protein